MSVYMTEEEQLESIKKWWKRYGNGVGILVTLALLSVAGYRYFYWHQEKLSQQASTTYEHMMLALSNQNIKVVRSYANKLIHDHAGSVYADAAHMTLAKIYVSKSNLKKAKEELEAVTTYSKIATLKQIAKIRVARIFAAEKSYDDALNELKNIDDNTYLPVINELKGDIYGSTGHYKNAIDAYKLALDEVKINGMGNLFLEMKTNEIASRSQSMVFENKKIRST